MHIISVTNSKGGSGKTTLAVNLAAALAEMGHRSVLIDMDPQNHCASSLAIPTMSQHNQESHLDSEEETIDPLADHFASALLDPSLSHEQLLEITVDQTWQMSRCLKVMPAGEKLNQQLFQLIGGSEIDAANQIRQRLQKAFGNEAFIVIDTASSRHPISQLINRIAHRILVPVNNDYLCLESAFALLNQHPDQRAHWVGMNLSSYSPDSKRAAQRLGEASCLGIIEHDKVFMDGVQVGRSVCQLAPESQAATQIKEVAEKIINSREYSELIPIFGTDTRESQVPISDPAPTSSPRLSRAAELVQRARELTGRTQAAQSGQIRQPELKLQDNTAEAAPTGRHFGVFVQADTLRFTQPLGNADQMAVVGNFGHTGTEIHPMTRNETEGVWEAKILVNPGEYHYQLVIDGELASDPFNAPVSRHGSHVSTEQEVKSDWQKTA